ncbi:MAG TPA: hypothetical protein VLA88_06080 [Candidatus Saccharimonadales bacterium]|nr:hypothetical protein [Candidatus Saccharimonadales bacterium]
MADNSKGRVEFSALQERIALLVAEGLGNRQIGESLSMSEADAKASLKQIFRLAGVSTREALVAFLIKRYMSSEQLEGLASLPVIANALELFRHCTINQLIFLNRLADNPEAMSTRTSDCSKSSTSTQIRRLAAPLKIGGRGTRAMVIAVCLLARWRAQRGEDVLTAEDISALQGKVLVRLASGRTNEEIASGLGIKESEVQRSIRDVALRAALPDERTSLALFAVRVLLTKEQRAEWRAAPAVARFRQMADSLLPRELQVFELLVAKPGIDDQAIAAQLDVSQEDVRAVIGRAIVTCGLVRREHARLLLAVYRYLANED